MRLTLAGSRLAWPLAALAAAVVLLVSESGHDTSVRALNKLGERAVANLKIERVLRRVLDAETGQRGYLLTGRTVYLEPYAEAAADTVDALDWLQVFYADDSRGQALLAALRSRTQSRLDELGGVVRAFDPVRPADMALRLAVASTDAMEDMRRLVDALASDQRQQIQRERGAVFGTLRTSRIGVNLCAGVSLLAVMLVLWQMRSLDGIQHRHALDLLAEQQRLEDEVQRRSADLSALARHLQTVREDESSRLARDLHEELGSLLTATKLDLMRLRRDLAGGPVDALARLDHLSTTIDSGISLKRRIIEDLRPASLSNLGLVSALDILAREFSERSGVPVHTDLQPVALPDAAQITVFRLVQEALTNIAKYAHARSVSVSLRPQNGQAEVSVHDDGRGFDPQAPRRAAHGLMGMRYRVQAMGGVLRIESAPGEGTRINAGLPMLQGLQDLQEANA
jgi:signal transduction histidine kinase